MVAGIVRIAGATGGLLNTAMGGRQESAMENQHLRHNAAEQAAAGTITPIELKSDVMSAMEKQSVAGGDRWFFKSSLLLDGWQVWADAFPRARWVIVRRSTRSIVNSCIHTGFMTQCQTHEEWQAWAQAKVEKLLALRDCTCSREVWPERFLSGNFDEINALIKWLGLQWDGLTLGQVIKAFWGGKHG